MRKILFSAVLLGAGIFYSCSKEELKNALTVEFTVAQKVELTLPKADTFVTGEISLPVIPVTTNWNGTFSKNKSDLNHIKSLNISEMILHAKVPAGQTLHFLKSITLYIADSASNTAKIAFKVPVPDNVDSTLTMDITNTELSKYFKNEKFGLKVTLEQREATKNEIKLEADMKFTTVAFILN